MRRIVPGNAVGVLLATVVVAGMSATPVKAQNAAIADLRGKIFDAKMAQQAFAGGLKHCSELDGSNFYFQPRDRVLNLDEYHRSLDSLALQGVFNPATHKPWNQQDADARWAEVREQAIKDQANCALVASLPEMQKKLEELQRQAAAVQQTNPPPDKK